MIKACKYTRSYYPDIMDSSSVYKEVIIIIPEYEIGVAIYNGVLSIDSSNYLDKEINSQIRTNNWGLHQHTIFKGPVKEIEISQEDANQIRSIYQTQKALARSKEIMYDKLEKY